ncbi:hypothetical protein DPSP01_013035 [Paraphaeosphaeria sporulosa]
MQTLMTASKAFDIELPIKEMPFNDLNHAGTVVSFPENHWVSGWEELNYGRNTALRCTEDGQAWRLHMMNINAFALPFIPMFAVIVTLLDLVLLKLLIYLKYSRKLLAPRIDRCNQDGVCQLRRRAYELGDQRHWARLAKEVPLIWEGDQLSEKWTFVPTERNWSKSFQLMNYMLLSRPATKTRKQASARLPAARVLTYLLLRIP